MTSIATTKIRNIKAGVQKQKRQKEDKCVHVDRKTFVSCFLILLPFLQCVFVFSCEY